MPSRRDDLAALTENANQALGAIAQRNAEFDRSLVALPPFLRQANTTFVNLRAALDDLDPLVQDALVGTKDLAPFLRDVRTVVDPAIPVFDDLTVALDRKGPSNDLTDALLASPATEKAASQSVEPTLAALDAGQPNVAFARPYTPDLIGLLAKFGQVTAYYDADGHYARVAPAGANIFQNTGGTLTPLAPAQQFDQYAALGLGPFLRCPGGSTQAGAAGRPPIPRSGPPRRRLQSRRGTPGRMRRALAIVVVILGCVVLLSVGSAAGGEEGNYEVRAAFDNAAFLVNGEEVRIAGANVGVITDVTVSEYDEAIREDGSADPGKAIVVMRIDDPGFQDFRADASCLIRPQSLIGEKFVECEPTQPRAAGTEPPPPLEQIPDGEPARASTCCRWSATARRSISTSSTTSCEQPYPDRFRLILNDLGAGLAARGDDLAEIIERANPALRETNEVLAILARQNRHLEQARRRLRHDRRAPLAPRARTSSASSTRPDGRRGDRERSADLEEQLRAAARLPARAAPDDGPPRRLLRPARRRCSRPRVAAPSTDPTPSSRAAAVLGRGHAGASRPRQGRRGRSGRSARADPVVNQVRGLAKARRPCEALRQLLAACRTDRRLRGHRRVPATTPPARSTAFDQYGHYLAPRCRLTNCVGY